MKKMEVVLWTYRGSFGVNEVDLNGNAGPGYDKLKSFRINYIGNNKTKSYALSTGSRQFFCG